MIEGRWLSNALVQVQAHLTIARAAATEKFACLLQRSLDSRTASWSPRGELSEFRIPIDIDVVAILDAY
jgi:hypothetical protein